MLKDIIVVVAIVPISDIAVVGHTLAVVVGSKCRYLTTFSITSIKVIEIIILSIWLIWVIIIFEQRWRIQPR